MNKKILPPAMLAMMTLFGGAGSPGVLTAGRSGGDGNHEPLPPPELTERDKMYIEAAKAKRARKGAKRLAAMAKQKR